MVVVLLNGMGHAKITTGLRIRRSVFQVLRWRYRLRVRTLPSQGKNPGSNPGIATIIWLFLSSAAIVRVVPRHYLHHNPTSELWLRFSFGGTKRQRLRGLSHPSRSRMLTVEGEKSISDTGDAQ